MDLLDLLDVLFYLLIHVEEIELIDVCRIQTIFGLQLFGVLQVNCLVVLLVATLASAFPFLLGRDEAAASASMSVCEGAFGHELRPGTALVVGCLTMSDDSTFLESSTANLNH